MTPQAQRQTVSQMMMDHAPIAYQQLKESQELEATLDSLVGEIVETKEQARDQAIGATRLETSPQYQADPMAATQALTEAFNAAERQALDQALERIKAIETTALAMES